MDKLYQQKKRMQDMKPKYFNIPILEDISEEKFKELVKDLAYPLIIRNYKGIKNWEIFHWNLGKISMKFADYEVSPRLKFPHPDNTEVNLFTMTSQEYPAKKTMKMNEFIKLIKNPDAENAPTYLQPGIDSKKNFGRN